MTGIMIPWAVSTVQAAHLLSFLNKGVTSHGRVLKVIFDLCQKGKKKDEAAEIFFKLSCRK
jgi:hypothetical protein